MHRHDEITCTVIALLNHFWNLKLEDRAEDDTNKRCAYSISISRKPRQVCPYSLARPMHQNHWNITTAEHVSEINVLRYNAHARALSSLTASDAHVRGLTCVARTWTFRTSVSATLNSHRSPNFLVRLMTYCFRKHYKTLTMSFNPTYRNVLNFAIISETAHTINY